MVRAKIVQEELTENNFHLFAICLNLSNAILVLLSDDEDSLGTLAASVPPKTEIKTAAFLSSILLGDRNTTTARMLAERLATRTGKLSLVSVYLKKFNETQVVPALLKLFEKVTSQNDKK